MLEASTAYNNGDYQKAISAAEEALTVSDNSRKASIYQFLAFSYQELNDNAKALDNVNRAIEVLDKNIIDYDIVLRELNNMKAKLE